MESFSRVINPVLVIQAVAKGLAPFNDLIVGDRAFQIPLYQRQYSWSKQQLEDLWNDLYYLESNKKHYFGTILLKETDETFRAGLKDYKRVELIDGQQRITTVLILMAEILTCLEQEVDTAEEQEEIAKIREDYLKYKSAYKLYLLGDDDQYFRENIIDGKDFPEDLLTPSRRRLFEAKVYFRKRLESVRTGNPRRFKEFLLRFKAKIDALEVVRYAIDDEEDAVLIFETVNDRGRPLSRLEKTKSFLMHMVYLCETENSDPKLAAINEDFGNVFKYVEAITESPRGEDFDEESIQRYHYVISESSKKEEYQDYLQQFKRKVRLMYRDKKTRPECLSYIMTYSADLERSFFTVKEIIGYTKDDPLGTWLRRFFALGRTANFMPLLIALWIRSKGDSKALVRVLKRVESYAFRAYAIGNRRADTGIGQLYELANELYHNKMNIDEIEETLSELTDTYADDGRFESDLGQENFYEEVESRDIKYLMYAYERRLAREEKEPLEISLDDWLTDKWEVEHIWADNATVSRDLEEVHEEQKHRLGNLTVASKPWNAGWGKKSFAKKRDEYVTSSLRVQRELCANHDWGKKQVVNRTKALTSFALERWPY